MHTIKLQIQLKAMKIYAFSKQAHCFVLDYFKVLYGPN